YEADRPSLLGLTRLTTRPTFPPGGIELYRRIANLIELGPDKEFLVAPCGLGVTARYLAESSGASGAGVDPDPELAERATQLTKQAGLSERLHFEPAALDDLPYQDAVFDVVVGELPLSSAPDPAAAIRELARVTRPMGTVVLIQLVWTGHVDPGRREMIVDHL